MYPTLENKPLPNHSTTPQPKIISSGSCESQASDETTTSQIPPILWNPKKREQKETMGIYPM